MEKKPIKETKFGQFLSKAGEQLKDKGPDLLQIGMQAASGNIIGAIASTKEMLLNHQDRDLSDPLLIELHQRQQEFEIELYRIEVEDRNSARNREIEVAKTGRQDWMMTVTGLVGLASFMIMIFAVIFIEDVQRNDLFIHLIGMIEGVVIGNIFAYYYGTSKSSKDKQEALNSKL